MRRAKQSIFICVFFLLLNGYHCLSQTAREIIPLNNNWQFKKGADDYKSSINFVENDWETVSIPHTYNDEDMQQGKEFYDGDAFYKKSLFIHDSLSKKRLFLKFNGVGSVASVYINGKKITTHQGAYSAFSFEMTHSVNYGEQNTLLVKVNNAPREDVIPVNHYLFPIYGGIYRPVSLIVTNQMNITVTDDASSGVYISQTQPSDSLANINILTKLDSRMPQVEPVQLVCTVRDGEQNFITSAKKDVQLSPQGVQFVQSELSIKNPRLWDGVHDPYLYSVTVQLKKGNTVLDEVTEPLGVRTIELKAGDGVYLNGKKYPMYGVTRHQDWWKKGSALTEADHQHDMDLIKEIGATTIRLAHYQQSKTMYSIADSMGFLIWAEIPFVNKVTGLEADNAKQQVREMIKQNYNHPSIYTWGLHNEVYSKTKDGFVPTLTKELHDIAKTLDPNRPTVAVSGYGEIDKPFNLTTDIQGINRYFGWYYGEIEDLEQWADMIEDEFSDHKVMLAEYGADGNIDQSAETLPTVDDIDPVNGQYSPEAYQTETHIKQWAIIEENPQIIASYLWNMFEFATPLWNRGGVNARNLKGIITFDRKRKKDSFYWYKANWNSEPMLYIANRRDSLRTKADTQIQVFTNASDVSITVNDAKVNGKQGVNNHHWLFDITLQPGKNEINASATAGNETLHDSITWILEK